MGPFLNMRNTRVVYRQEYVHHDSINIDIVTVIDIAIYIVIAWH